MKFLLNTQEERCRMEVYNEYLRKIPQLLEQLEAVEKMYEKAVMEEKMLETKADDNSRALYADRLARTKKQCKDRADDIREQARLIFALKAQIDKMKAQILELWEELPPTFVSSSETGLGREEILDYIGSVLESLKEEQN